MHHDQQPANAPARPGMLVYGSDGELVGRITAVHADPVVGSVDIDCQGGECRVPFTAVSQVEGERIILPNPAAQYLTQPWARAARSLRPDSAEAQPLPPDIDPRADTALYDEAR
jgi:hypothetical protein